MYSCLPMWSDLFNNTDSSYDYYTCCLYVLWTICFVVYISDPPSILWEFKGEVTEFHFSIQRPSYFINLVEIIDFLFSMFLDLHIMITWKLKHRALLVLINWIVFLNAAGVPNLDMFESVDDEKVNLIHDQYVADEWITWSQNLLFFLSLHGQSQSKWFRDFGLYPRFYYLFLIQ